MISIFNYLDYKIWIKEWLKARPKKGHGELLKMASLIKVNSTLISQVLAGRREFTVEQGFQLMPYFNLNQLEQKYFLSMLHYERAGTKELKDYYKAELNAHKASSNLIKNRVESDTEISDTDKSFLLSSWRPTAVLVFTGHPNGVSFEQVEAEFKIERDLLKQILDRLVEIGLVKLNDGLYKTGFKRLHIPKGSSFLIRHYSNWRLKSINHAEVLSDTDAMYTSVASVSEKDIPILKEKILTWITEYAKNISASGSEKVVCFNLDFFKV